MPPVRHVVSPAIQRRSGGKLVLLFHFDQGKVWLLKEGLRMLWNYQLLSDGRSVSIGEVFFHCKDHTVGDDGQQDGIFERSAHERRSNANHFVSG